MDPLFKGNIKDIERIITSDLPLDFKHVRKTIKKQDTKEPGYSSIYENCLCENDSLISTVHPSLTTLHDLFEASCDIYTTSDCLGERKYDVVTDEYESKFTFENYLTIRQRRNHVGSGILNFLQNNEFKTEQHNLKDFILTLYSGNRLEWFLTDLACQSFSITDTSLYDTLGPETSKYILDLTNSPIVVCSKDKLNKLLQIKLENELPFFIGVVSMDVITDPRLYAKFHNAGIELIDFKHLEYLGIKQPQRLRRPNPDTIYTLSFTSGTTGVPKGVMLKHSTAVSAISFALIHLQRLKKRHNRYALSFLPLAHIFERQMSMVGLTKGVAIGFPPNSDSDSLIENLRILKPCYLAAVPRIYSKIDSMIRISLSDWGLQNASKKATRRKLRQLFGFDNIEFVMTASAPINKRTMEFVSTSLDVGFIQLYGCTETYGALTRSSGYEFSGSSGPAGSTCEIKLKGMPQLGYHVESTTTGEELDSVGGELLMRGPQIFLGYYKRPDATAEVLDKEGWFHTGDIARLDEEGRIHIIDRVKHFFKLQQGEYIIPEKIENIYLSSNPILTQLYIHGEPEKDFLIAIAGVNMKLVKNLLSGVSIADEHQHSSVDSLVEHDDVQLLQMINKSPALKRKLLDEINTDIVRQNLQGFEKIHNIYIDLEPLKLSDDAITPTMKLKREKCRSIFKEKLAELYDEGSLVKKTRL